MNLSDAPILRAAVRQIDVAVSKFAAGIAADGLALVVASCQDLRAAGLDETGTYLVSLIEHSALMLERADEHPSRMPSSEQRAGWEIELLKSVWKLDAHLLALSTSEAIHTSGNEATTTNKERPPNANVL